MDKKHYTKYKRQGMVKHLTGKQAERTFRFTTAPEQKKSDPPEKDTSLTNRKIFTRFA